jgi:alpha-beta hydrolase superfamily lysophospholipase
MSWLERLLAKVEDKKVRCGWHFLNTEPIWRALHKVGLTRHKQDPFLAVCAADDRLTDSKHVGSGLATNERELAAVEEMFSEVNKEVNHPRVAAAYKWVLRRVRKYFD